MNTAQPTSSAIEAVEFGFLSAHDGINNLFHLRRDRPPADRYRAARTQAFQTWAEVTGVARMA